MDLTTLVITSAVTAAVACRSCSLHELAHRQEIRGERPLTAPQPCMDTTATSSLCAGQLAVRVMCLGLVLSMGPLWLVADRDGDGTPAGGLVCVWLGLWDLCMGFSGAGIPHVPICVYLRQQLLGLTELCCIYCWISVLVAWLLCGPCACVSAQAGFWEP